MSLFIVICHCVKKSLFITYHIIIDKMVLHPQFSNTISSYFTSIFEVFTPWKHTLIAMLFRTIITIHIITVLLRISCSQQWILLITLIMRILGIRWRSTLSLFLNLQRYSLLFFVKINNFQLSPHKVSLFRTLSKSKPSPPRDKTCHHARIISFSNVNFQSMFVF